MTSPACPVCRKPSDAAYRPFCSRRCADVDLQRWLSGRYAIPEAADDEEEDGALAPLNGEGRSRSDQGGDV